MSMKGNNDQERLKKQISLQYMKNLLKHLQTESPMKEKENHSFIYLENDSLTTLLIYLISQTNQETSYKIDHSPTEELDQLNKTLDASLEKNKEEFEALITLLKAKLS